MTLLRFLLAVSAVGGLAIVGLTLGEHFRYGFPSPDAEVLRVKLEAAERQRQLSDATLEAQRAMIETVIRGFGGRP